MTRPAIRSATAGVAVVAGLLLAATACTASGPQPVAAATSPQVDLAELAASGTVSPVDGLSTAGQPDRAALEVFARAGYAAVIDLRGPGEDRGMDEAAEVESLGMDYVSLPVQGAAGISYENAALLDEILQAYEQPVLLHCGSGNRVGALLALRARQKGADAETALQYGRDAGLTRLEPVVRERLNQNP